MINEFQNRGCHVYKEYVADSPKVDKKEEFVLISSFLILI
jgi:hypothetical protein